MDRFTTSLNCAGEQHLGRAPAGTPTRRVDRVHHRPTGRRVRHHGVEGAERARRRGGGHPPAGRGPAAASTGTAGRRSPSPPRRSRWSFYGTESNLAIQIMTGVERVARQQDLAVGFTDALSTVEGTRSWSEQVLHRRPLGVIAIHSTFTARTARPTRGRRYPAGGARPDRASRAQATPSVGATNWSGGVTAARHLLELGHRRIAVISGPTDYLCARARLEACRAALDTAGVPLDGRLVRTGRFQFDGGLRPRRGPAWTDRPADGCPVRQRPAGDGRLRGGPAGRATHSGGPQRRRLRRHRRRAVLPAADDHGAAAVHARWAQAAAQMLLTLAAGRTPPLTRMELATTLVVRASTAPPPPH